MKTPLCPRLKCNSSLVTECRSNHGDSKHYWVCSHCGNHWLMTEQPAITRLLGERYHRTKAALFEYRLALEAENYTDAASAVSGIERALEQMQNAIGAAHRR